MSPQTLPQQVITILLCAIATMCTRFLPFLLFGGKKEVPPIILYLGKALPSAVFAMLVVYCLKSVSVTSFPFGIPELIGITVTVVMHLWKKNTLLSMFAGTLVYMLLVQLVF
ncbi:MAG: branched-chain amino acid transporter permease [Solobacterium sp.]|nr:branched-chain amino acid transporter permease [Solobacterium sp.]